MSDTINITANEEIVKNIDNQQTETQQTETQPKYATLMETSGEECESWLYFIKYQGNEDNLEKLQSLLAQVDWFVMEDMSTFDLETKFLVCETTAKEMTKVDLNHTSFNRKFDGVLTEIKVAFKKRDSNEKKIKKVFDVLGYGQIENFIDNEDIDDSDTIHEGDITSEDNTEEDNTEEDTSDDNEDKDNTENEQDDSSDKEESEDNKIKSLPSYLTK
jgi:hypothetical protein